MGAAFHSHDTMHGDSLHYMAFLLCMSMEKYAGGYRNEFVIVFVSFYAAGYSSCSSQPYIHHAPRRDVFRRLFFPAYGGGGCIAVQLIENPLATAWY